MDMKKPSDVMLLIGVAFFLILLAVSLSLPEPTKSIADISDGGHYSDYVVLGDYKNLTVSSTKSEVTDEDVDALYDNFKANYLTYTEDTNNKVDAGDMVTINYTIDGNDTVLTVEGVAGSDDIPAEFSSAIMDLAVGESAVVDLSGNENGQCYYLTINHIHEPVAFTDEYISSLNLPDVKSVDDVRQQLRSYLEKDNSKAYADRAKEELIAKVYNSSEFKDMPSELIEPFKQQLKTRLDNAVSAYELQGETKTYDDILADTYKKDGISSVDEYLELYSLQNARTFAMCEKIAQIEGITPDLQSVYSLAATDWANVKDSYTDLNAFLESNDITVYERAELLEEVKQFLFDNAVVSE